MLLNKNQSLLLAIEVIKMILSNIIKFIIFILVPIMLLLGIPFPIDKEITAKEIILTDPDHMQFRTVTLQGWYIHRIIGDIDTFRGHIHVSGSGFEDLTKYGFLNRHIDLQQSRERNVRSNFMFYRTQYDTMPREAGILYTLPFFSASAILLTDDFASNSHTFPWVVFNAYTREEAVNVLERLLGSIGIPPQD